MTDNEIIKALECCIIGCNAEGCDDCPLYEKVEDCEIEIPIISLDLINRQKEEIERLKTDNALLRQDSNADTAEIRALRRKLETSKSEAIKEFAEELKKKLIKKMSLAFDRNCYSYKAVISYQTSPETIDDVVKEMTEGENG